MLVRRQKAIENFGEPTTARSNLIVLYTLGFCVTGIMVPSFYMQHIQPLEWFMIPFTFFISNLVEYGLHRWPMHKRYKYTGFILRNHMIHHNYFDENEYTIKQYPDFVFAVFPAIVLNILTVFIVLPMAHLFFLIAGNNAALLFIASVMAYYLLMEFIHTAAHTDENHWVNAFPGMKYLRRHHYIHHHHDEMTRANYNFIIPVADWIFGTHKMEL